jgi:hypothetical protein
VKKISQREARKLRKRVAELEKRNEQNANAWAREYIGGVHVANATVSDVSHAICRTARKLGHALVAVPGSDNGKYELSLFAVKP